MLTLPQISQKTNLAETDVQLVLGAKDIYTSQDLETLEEVIKLQQVKKFESIQVTLEHIQGQLEELPLSALLNKGLDGLLAGYMTPLQKIYETVDANCDMMTTAFAQRLHQRLMMMDTETIQKLIKLVQTKPVAEPPTNQVLKETLWRSCFRRYVPELPKASNRINGNGKSSY